MPKIKTLPLTINEEQQMFYQAHSLGIMQFATMEQDLGSLVAAGVDKKSAVAIRTAFFGIESFRTKLEFADRYIQLWLQDEPALLADWQGVMESCRGANSSRNMIVHYNRIVYMHEAPGRRIVLVPPPLNPTRQLALEKTPSKAGLAPSYAIGVHRLVEIRYAIFATIVRLQRFKAAASNQKVPAEEMLVPKAPTLNHLVEQHRSSVMATAAYLT